MRKIRVIKRRIIYQGPVIRLVHEWLKTSQGQPMIRETIQHPGSVVIAPLLDREHLVFVRQYRRAIDREILELPAGTLDVAGESILACARRELEEETGWKASCMRLIARFYAAPGLLSEQMHLFIAEELTPVGAHPQADEEVKPVILSLDEAIVKIQTGLICDAKTIIGVWLTLGKLASSKLHLKH